MLSDRLEVLLNTIIDNHCFFVTKTFHMHSIISSLSVFKSNRRKMHGVQKLEDGVEREATNLAVVTHRMERVGPCVNVPG